MVDAQIFASFLVSLVEVHVFLLFYDKKKEKKKIKTQHSSSENKSYLI